VPKNKGKAKPKLTRRGTFVQEKHLTIDKANAPARSLNEVKRAALNPKAPTEEGGAWSSNTVFFKPHDQKDAASQYAVASTRLARFIGMPNLVARNAFGKAKKTLGLVSVTAPGGQLFSVERDKLYPVPPNTGPQEMAGIAAGSQLELRKGKYYDISGYIYQWVDFRDARIQKGLSDLQLFDALSGQTDRHGGNILVDPNTGQITGIDDDKSFGNGKPPEDLADLGGRLDKYAGLPALVDLETADKILDLDLSDLPRELVPRENDSVELSNAEIEDAMRRFKGVQTYLRTLKANGALVGQNGTTWDDATYDQTMQGPDTNYLKRQATDLDNAIQRSANDPLYVVKGVPAIMPAQIPPLPAVPPGMPPGNVHVPANVGPPPVVVVPPPPPNVPPPLVNQPPQVVNQPPPLTNLAAPPTWQPAATGLPSFASGPISPRRGGPSQAAAFRLGTRPERKKRYVTTRTRPPQQRIMVDSNTDESDTDETDSSSSTEET
jgi:hypothetical protein